MSSKPRKSKETSPNKSEPQKAITRPNTQRKLRNMDRSMKNITQLLKSTPRNKSSYVIKNISKQSNKTNKSDRFKLDDITNVPLTKTITIKHIDSLESTQKQKPVKPNRPISNQSQKNKRTSTPINTDKTITKPIIVTPIITKPIITKPIKPIIDTIKPHVTIRRRKIQIKNKKSQQISQVTVEKRSKQNRNDWLKHKHAYKTICRVEGVVRRKLFIPKQGTNTIKPQTPNHIVPESVSKDLGVKELVQVADDEGLDDDDLMEILTCPSPVWWENPGEDEYFEDAIPLQIAVDTRFIPDELLKEINDNSEPNIPLFDVKINKHDKQFMQKRSKLEILLGNMKNSSKILDSGALSSNSVNKVFLNDERSEKLLKKTDISYERNDDEFQAQIIMKHKDKEEDRNDTTPKELNDNSEKCFCKVINKMNMDFKENKINSKDSQILDLVDITDAENNTNNVECDKTNEYETNSNEIEVLKYRKTENRTSTSSDEIFFESVSDDMLNDLENVNIPIEGREVIEIIDETRDIDPNSSISTNLDSISDTNIQFIMDDTNPSTPNEHQINTNINNEENITDNDKIRIKIKDTYKEIMKNMSSKSIDYIFVPINMNTSENNAKSNENTSKASSDDDKIKYCFKCSSIFEMDVCQKCK